MPLQPENFSLEIASPFAVCPDDRIAGVGSSDACGRCNGSTLQSASRRLDTRTAVPSQEASFMLSVGPQILRLFKATRTASRVWKWPAKARQMNRAWASFVRRLLVKQLQLQAESQSSLVHGQTTNPLPNLPNPFSVENLIPFPQPDQRANTCF